MYAKYQVDIDFFLRIKATFINHISKSYKSEDHPHPLLPRLQFDAEYTQVHSVAWPHIPVSSLPSGLAHGQPCLPPCVWQMVLPGRRFLVAWISAIIPAQSNLGPWFAPRVLIRLRQSDSKHVGCLIHSITNLSPWRQASASAFFRDPQCLRNHHAVSIIFPSGSRARHARIGAKTCICV
jgi:hypothetical protein